jgi:hypothetical protein
MSPPQSSGTNPPTTDARIMPSQIRGNDLTAPVDNKGKPAGLQKGGGIGAAGCIAASATLHPHTGQTAKRCQCLAGALFLSSRVTWRSTRRRVAKWTSAAITSFSDRPYRA